MVWIYNNTGHSILAMVLFHAMINESEMMFPNLGSHYDPFIPFVILTVIAAIVVSSGAARVRRRPKMLHRPHRSYFEGFTQSAIAHAFREQLPDLCLDFFCRVARSLVQSEALSSRVLMEPLKPSRRKKKT
jgi:hypothetical protein